MDKNYRYPIFSKSAQAAGRIKWNFLLDLAGTFFKPPLFHRSKTIWKKEISKFKALILENPEDLLALGEDLTYFQPYTVFMTKAVS